MKSPKYLARHRTKPSQKTSVQFKVEKKKKRCGGERNFRYSALHTNPNSRESLVNTGYQYLPWSPWASSAGLLRGKRVHSCSLPLCSQELCTQMIRWLLEADPTPPWSWMPLPPVLLLLSPSQELKAGRWDVPGIWWPLVGLICFASLSDKSADTVIWSHFCLLAPYWESEIVWIEFSQFYLDWCYYLQALTTTYFPLDFVAEESDLLQYILYNKHQLEDKNVIVFGQLLLSTFERLGCEREESAASAKRQG